MAGSTLTDDFWANDILWQLSVFAYNISVMMRQKNNHKKQEHRSFIDRFISVPAKITRSRHHVELNTLAQKTGISREYHQRAEAYRILLGTNSKVNLFTFGE